MCLAVTAGLSVAPYAAADTWDNSSGNAQWSTASNWVDNTEPASTAEPVTFPNPGGFYNPNISLSAGEVCGSLTFNSTYNLNSGTLNVGAAGGPIDVNTFVTATINSVLNGTQGLTKNGAGTLALAGTNTFSGNVTINAGTLRSVHLGNGGNNNVVINGGTLEATESLFISRSFTLNSADSAMTVAGELTIYGDGALDIAAGAQLQDEHGQVGVFAGDTYIATVEGANSQWINSGNMFIARFGSGTLNITSGGLVQSVFCTAATDAGSTGNISVDGPNSRLICSDLLRIAGSGQSTLSITNGGLVQSPGSDVAIADGGIGTITVSGPDSRWVNSGNLSLAVFGPGTLNILAGGTVTLGGDLLDPTPAGSVSTLTLEGGTLDMQGHNIGVSGQVIISRNFRSGTLKNVAQINNGAGLTKTTAGTLILSTANTYTGPTLINEGILHVSNTAGSATGTGTVRVASGATLQGSGFVGGPVQNNGTVAPGASAGILTIQNSYTQSASGALEIEIGGTMVGGQHDILTIVGNAALDGIVDVALINGFLPVAGQQFTILTANSIVDNGLALSGSAASSFSLLVNNSSVILQAIAVGLPGDYNANGTVDAADYVVWRKNEGTTNALPNDPIGGTVGTAHYNQWRAHFGQTAGPGSGAAQLAAVPEPMTLLMLLTAMTVAGLPRPRTA